MPCNVRSVMGGLSTGNVSLERQGEASILHLQGTVNTPKATAVSFRRGLSCRKGCQNQQLDWCCA